MLQINNIKNETIKKLDRNEIADLDLLNFGVYTYIGIPKSRVKGFKTTLKTETEIHYEGENVRYEVIKTQDYKSFDGELVTNNYAVRRFNKVNNAYEEFWQVLWGCNFFKIK